MFNGIETATIDPRLDSRLEELLLERYRLLIKYDQSRAEAIQNDIKGNICMAQKYLRAFEQVAAPATSTLAHVTLSVVCCYLSPDGLLRVLKLHSLGAISTRKLLPGTISRPVFLPTE